MASRTEVYLDTSAFVAFADVSDTYHPLFRRLFSDPPTGVYTSSLVVTEGHAWFLRRYDRNRALKFMGMIETMNFLEIVSAGTAELMAGTELLRKFADQNLTLVDAVGLYLMKRHRSKRCWSTDRHLGLTGVRLAIDEH